jgi:hypothetical protein
VTLNKQYCKRVDLYHKRVNVDKARRSFATIATGWNAITISPRFATILAKGLGVSPVTLHIPLSTIYNKRVQGATPNIEYSGISSVGEWSKIILDGSAREVTEIVWPKWMRHRQPPCG